MWLRKLTFNLKFLFVLVDSMTSERTFHRKRCGLKILFEKISCEPFEISCEKLPFKMSWQRRCRTFSSPAALMSGVVLLNLPSIFLTKSSLKPSFSSTIQTSPILYGLSPIVVLLQIFPFSNTILTEIAFWKSRILFLIFPFQVILPNPRALAHKSSFIRRNSQLWNSFPPTTFSESYNLLSLKSNMNKIDLVSLST